MFLYDLFKKLFDRSNDLILNSRAKFRMHGKRNYGTAQCFSYRQLATWPVCFECLLFIKRNGIIRACRDVLVDTEQESILIRLSNRRGLNRHGHRCIGEARRILNAISNFSRISTISFGSVSKLRRLIVSGFLQIIRSWYRANNLS